MCILYNMCKGKGKVLPRTGHECPDGEQRYSSTLSLTLTLDGGGWSTPRPGRFTSGKETRYPLYRRLGGPQGRSRRLRKISPPPGFDPLTVQPVPTTLSRPTYNIFIIYNIYFYLIYLIQKVISRYCLNLRILFMTSFPVGRHSQTLRSDGVSQ